MFGTGIGPQARRRARDRFLGKFCGREGGLRRAVLLIARARAAGFARLVHGPVHSGMRRRLMQSAMLALGVLTVAGCSSVAPKTTATERGTMRLAITSEPHSLNPIYIQSIPDNDVLRLMYDPLIAADKAGNLVPALARSVPSRGNGGISADGLTITYHLRHDVLWHDGKPFTSADVAFSVRTVLDPKNNVVSRRGYDAIASVATPDAYTVRFRLKHRFAPFVATVFSESDSPYYIVPAHLPDSARERGPFSTNPVGTGPFSFVSWRRNDALELISNDAYYRGKPKLRGVVIRFVPNENTEIAQIRAGEIDGVLNIGANAAALLKDVARVNIVATPANGYYGVMFNTRRVADVRVRRALAMAIDARAFRERIVHGYYGPAAGDIPSFLWAYDPSVRPIAYDPAGARALLTAAGYSPQHPLDFDLAIITGFRTHQEWAVQLQAALRPLGVNVQIHPYLGQVFAAPAAEHGILAGGQYDGAIYGWYSGVDPDNSSQFLCDQRPPAGYNDSFYCNAQMDAAQKIALDNYDRPARKRAYATIERLLLRDVPIAFVATPTEITILASAVTGYSPNPVCPTAFAERWSL
jgi:peptide/nickel transport system substrate-binding protein